MSYDKARIGRDNTGLNLSGAGVLALQSSAYFKLVIGQLDIDVLDIQIFNSELNFSPFSKELASSHSKLRL